MIPRTWMAFAMCGSVLAVTIALSAADASVNRSPRDECLPGNVQFEKEVDIYISA